MTPIDFVTATSDHYNDPVGPINEALVKQLVITDGAHEYEILSYYLADGQMTLDIQRKD